MTRKKWKNKLKKTWEKVELKLKEDGWEKRVGINERIKWIKSVLRRYDIFFFFFLPWGKEGGFSNVD